MSDRDKQKAYIPWHDRIDEALIKHITQQFVKDAFAKGFRVFSVTVEWRDDGNFDVQTAGKAFERIKPRRDERLH